MFRIRKEEMNHEVIGPNYYMTQPIINNRDSILFQKKCKTKEDENISLVCQLKP